jgi:hypothetical protein
MKLGSFGQVHHHTVDRPDRQGEGEREQDAQPHVHVQLGDGEAR